MSTDAAAPNEVNEVHSSVNKLFVSNISRKVTEGELEEAFKEYEVNSVSIPLNRRTGKNLGYAFVELASGDNLEKAMAEMTGVELNERQLKVKLADPSKKAQAKPRKANKASAKTPAQERKRKEPRTGGVPKETQLFITGIPFKASEEELKECFAEFEPVSVELVYRRLSKKQLAESEGSEEAEVKRHHKGFGFVDLKDKETLDKILEVPEFKLHDKKLKVVVALEFPEETEETENKE